MLAEWEKKHPGRTETIFRALGNVAPSQLADRNLFDFAGLGASAVTPRPDARAWLAGAEPAPVDGPS
jgi:tRNA 2-thiocytidine biosynthesis protein TtcA